jgi:hypothetical protein
MKESKIGTSLDSLFITGVVEDNGPVCLSPLLNSWFMDANRILLTKHSFAFMEANRVTKNSKSDVEQRRCVLVRGEGGRTVGGGSRVEKVGSLER